MNKVFAIARNTFREAIRNKILYAILFFAVLVLFASLILGELSLNQGIKVTQDTGLTAISAFGILIAIFIGVSLVHRELDKRTIYTLISKPIHRHHFFLGKYFGMLMTAFVQVFVLTLVFTLLLFYQYNWGYIEFNVYSAIFLYWIEIMLITSVALFFSSFTTPFFSGVFTFSIFIIGRIMPEVEMIMDKLENPALWVLLKVSTALPNLQTFNITDKVVHGEIIESTYILSSTMYGLFYTLLFLLLGSLLFSRRDFV